MASFNQKYSIALNMPALSHKEDLYGADGTIGKAIRMFLQGWVASYGVFVKKHAGAD